MADSNGTRTANRVTREKQEFVLGNVKMEIAAGAEIDDLMFHAGMFVDEAIALTNDLAGEGTEELSYRPNSFNGLRHLLELSSAMISAATEAEAANV